MDRILSQSEQKNNRGKNILTILAVAGLIALAVFGFRQLLHKKVEENDIITAKVIKGEMKNTLSATGIVVPAVEREINAPVSTEIKSTHQQRGSEVKQGDLIISLDDNFVQLEVDKLKDELALRKNNIHRLRLTYDKDLRDLELRDQIKALQLTELEAQVKDQRRLEKIGGATMEEVEKAESQLKVAAIEKKMLENELNFQQSVNSTNKANLELEYNIQQKSLSELQQKLQKTKVRATQSGVITWINEDIGKKVAEGEPLIRIADLSRYKIEARCADRFAAKLFVGQVVSVRVNKQRYTGSIDRIFPEIVDNTIRFLVQLEKAENNNLRPQMKTEVFVVTDERPATLKVKKGLAIKGSQSQDIFVIRNGEAVKTRIKKGLVNSEYVEIVEGLEEGDEILISDMEDYKHLESFSLTKSKLGI